MNTKLFLVVFGIILTSATGLADAKSIRLSNAQMDTVTTGSEGGIFSQSYSFTQVVVNDDGTTHYSEFNTAQNGIYAGSQIFELGSLPNTQIPFTVFIAVP